MYTCSLLLYCSKKYDPSHQYPDKWNGSRVASCLSAYVCTTRRQQKVSCIRSWRGWVALLRLLKAIGMGRSVEEGSSDGESEAKCIPVRQPDEDDSHPSRSIRVARTMVDGVATDFLIQSFSDRIFVIVSQLNKLGTIVRKEVGERLHTYRGGL